MSRASRKRSTERFAMIPLRILEDTDYQALTLGAKHVLLCLAAQFNGHNNGHLTFTVSDGERYGIRSAKTRSHSLRDLARARLIVKTHQGDIQG